MEFKKIKTVQDAFAATGRDYSLRPDISKLSEEDGKMILTNYDLKVVVEAINMQNGKRWLPDFRPGNNEYKYNPYFWIEGNDEHPSGAGFSHSTFGSLDLGLGLRLAPLLQRSGALEVLHHTVCEPVGGRVHNSKITRAMQKQDQKVEPGKYSMKAGVFFKNETFIDGSCGFVATTNKDRFLDWILKEAQREDLARQDAARKERRQSLDIAIRAMETKLKYRRMGVLPYRLYLLSEFIKRKIKAIRHA